MYERHRGTGMGCRQIGSVLLLVVLAAVPALAANGTISGTVKDASGKGLGGALVVAYDATNNLYRAAAGDDGTYTISVAPGT
jgi:hypothetical protein